MNEHQLPPEQNLKELIRQEHHRAELERLHAGMEGCGCADCQSFYQTLDLSVYGERVKQTYEIISIHSGKSGAALWDIYNKDTTAAFNTSQNAPTRREVVSKLTDNGNIPVPDIQEQNKGVLIQKNKGGRPRKPEGTQVSRMTQWRRTKEAVQGVLL